MTHGITLHRESGVYLSANGNLVRSENIRPLYYADCDCGWYTPDDLDKQKIKDAAIQHLKENGITL